MIEENSKEAAEKKVDTPSRISALRALAVALLGFIFIAISSICIVELGSRISSKAFVLSKIDEIEKLSLNRSVSLAEDSSTEATVKATERNDEHHTYLLILDDLEHLL